VVLVAAHPALHAALLRHCLGLSPDDGSAAPGPQLRVAPGGLSLLQLAGAQGAAAAPPDGLPPPLLPRATVECLNSTAHL
jgi:hypothetical protein